MKKNKIKIKKISKELHRQKGFDRRGCYYSKCKDACCRYGSEFDRESYDLVFKHRNVIERAIKLSLDRCFKKKWDSDKEYLGGKSIDSKVGKNGYCVFHNKKGKGCILVSLYKKKKIPIRTLPSICRLYPLSWEDGELIVEDEVEPTCNCFDENNKTKRTLLHTQKKAIKDIFDIKNS